MSSKEGTASLVMLMCCRKNHAFCPACWKYTSKPLKQLSFHKCTDGEIEATEGQTLPLTLLLFRSTALHSKLDRVKKTNLKNVFHGPLLYHEAFASVYLFLQQSHWGNTWTCATFMVLQGFFSSFCNVGIYSCDYNMLCHDSLREKGITSRCSFDLT